jgi:branched-chain amino acid transport system ATP-binding protein
MSADTHSEEGALVLQDVSASYGSAKVLSGVSVTVPRGTLVALLGANGAGKTTLLRVAAGLLRPTAGAVRLEGADVTRQPPFQRLRGGLCLIPEGRGIFPSLTVRENLELQLPPWHKHARTDPALEVFPVLGNRMSQTAGTLSGGEQQMLAMSRAVLAEPKVILLDEISMGLAPLVVDQLFHVLQELAARGISMLVVEQYVHRALELCSLAYIMSKGSIVYSGPTAELERDTLLEGYLAAGSGNGSPPAPPSPAAASASNGSNRVTPTT